MEIFQILCNDILPLLFFIGAGYWLDGSFKLDLNTYNKLVIWVVLPCFMFYSMAQYEPDADTLFIIPAEILLLVVMACLSRVTSRFFHLENRQRAVFQAASTYSNAGNIGIALILFIYSHAPYADGGNAPFLPEARGTVVLLMILMNIAVNLFGACQIGAHAVSPMSVLRFLIKMPALYAVIAGLLVQYFSISLTHTFLWPVLHHFSGAFIVLVTMIVGAHLHRARMRRPTPAVLFTSFQKLIVSPLLAWAIITLFGGFTATEAQVFLIASAIPPSFTIVMYAAEYKNNSDLAAQSVLVSTFLGIITMTAVIYLARILYPVV